MSVLPAIKEFVEETLPKVQVIFCWPESKPPIKDVIKVRSYDTSIIEIRENGHLIHIYKQCLTSMSTYEVSKIMRKYPNNCGDGKGFTIDLQQPNSLSMAEEIITAIYDDFMRTLRREYCQDNASDQVFIPAA